MEALFNESQGPAVGNWQDDHFTLNNITCGGCGKIHSFRDLKEGESYGYLEFEGRIIVLNCCGAIFDRLHAQFGEKFFLESIKKFEKNPLAKELDYIQKSLSVAVNAWAKVTKGVPKLEKALKALKKLLPKI